MKFYGDHTVVTKLPTSREVAGLVSEEVALAGDKNTTSAVNSTIDTTAAATTSTATATATANDAMNHNSLGAEEGKGSVVGVGGESVVAESTLGGDGSNVLSESSTARGDDSVVEKIVGGGN